MKSILSYPRKALKALATTRPKFVSLEDYYGAVSKYNYRPAYQVQMPEAEEMVFREDAVHLQKSVYTVPQDFVSILDNACVSMRYNVLLTSRGNVIEESSNAGKDRYFSHTLFDKYKHVDIPGYATLLRSRFDNYYHFLVDDLPRLISLSRLHRLGQSEMRFLCTKPLSNMEKLCLDIIGFGDSKMETLTRGSICHVGKMVFTTYKTRYQSGFIPEDYVRAIRDGFLPDRPSRNNRLFISREKAGRRVIRNSDEVMALLKRRGFRKIIFEDLSPQDQINSVYDANVILGAHGAGLTNMLFSEAGLKVVELFPTNVAVPHYFYLSKSLGHQYVCQYGVGSDAWVDSFEVDVAQLASILDSIGVE